MPDHKHRATVDAKFAEILELLAEAKADAGHDPVVGRTVSVAITHTETSQLWAEKALAGTQP